MEKYHHVDLPYYAGHFFQVIGAVERHYNALFTDGERQYLALIYSLPTEALCLYVRLVNRKGPCFRLDRIDYEECGKVELAARLLIANGFLVECDTDCEALANAAIASYFTMPELRKLFAEALPKAVRTKPHLCEWLKTQAEHSAVILAYHPMVSLNPQDLWPFIKFLYFGEITDNLSGFVVQELGHIVTEKQPETMLSPHFKSRDEVDMCWRMASIYAEFRDIRDTASAAEVLSFWHSQEILRNKLPFKAMAIHDRLIDQIGKRLERAKQFELAKALYLQCPVSPCRDRLARLLLRENNKAEALALCRQMVADPCDDEEAYAARQLLAKHEEKQPRSDARNFLHFSKSVVLDMDGRPVEQSALAHYATEGWEGVHSENWLWNALFGLLLWDIVYDPSYGSFHQPLQVAPADLYTPDFYNLRAKAIAVRLSLLDDKSATLQFLYNVAESKKGIVNSFVSWHPDLLPVVTELVTRLPSSALKEVIGHLAKDTKNRRKGFPDLFLWRADEYQFLEIKSVNDQLSAQQFHWLQFLTKQGVNVQVLKVLFRANARAERPKVSA